MYEIFGTERPTAPVLNAGKPLATNRFAFPAAHKAELAEKRNVGVTKKVLTDVRNTVKLGAQNDITSQNMKKLSPLKSIKEKSVLSELRNDSITPCSSIKTAKKFDFSTHDKTPNIVKVTTLQKSSTKLPKIQIFSDDARDITGKELKSEDTLGTGEKVLQQNDFELPQKIFGYCPGYETPEEDPDEENWMSHKLWQNAEELLNIGNLETSSNKLISGTEETNLNIVETYTETEIEHFDLEFPSLNDDLIDIPPIEIPEIDW